MLKVTLEKVGAEYAQLLLDNHNTNNYRKLKPNTATEYASLMKEGRWRPEASSIVIDINGVLVDGQHRLTAITKLDSGETVDLIIIRDADPESVYVIDGHMPRRMNDHCKCEPYKIVMINTYLRSVGLHIKYRKDVKFYQAHVENTIGQMTQKLHEIYGRTSDPFTSVGLRAGLILGVLNKQITEEECIQLFEKFIAFRKKPKKKGEPQDYALASSTRSNVQSTLSPLQSLLVDRLDNDDLPIPVEIGTKWVNEKYSGAREKASKLMNATYQAICKSTKNDKKFSGALLASIKVVLDVKE